MRTFLVAVMLVLSSQPAWSEAKWVSFEQSETGYMVETVCLDGHKFVVANRYEFQTAVTIVQVYEERDGKALPAKC